MTKKKYLPVISILMIGIIIILFMKPGENEKKKITAPEPSPEVKSVNKTNSSLITDAEKIKIVHFHATQQCWSCIEVGKLAKQTLEEHFADELDSGKIEFLDINGELPDNREIVTKYQARGSSLFINAIKDGDEHITEDTTVWRYVANPTQFKKYFTQKINQLLGK
jgi:hypothetical protein